jgi:hypothetical protein
VKEEPIIFVKVNKSLFLLDARLVFSHRKKMDPKELLGLKKDHTSNLSENQEPSVKIIPIIKKTNKVNKRVTFDPDSTLLPSYTKVPLNESSIETSKLDLT